MPSSIRALGGIAGEQARHLVVIAHRAVQISIRRKRESTNAALVVQLAQIVNEMDLVEEFRQPVVDSIPFAKGTGS